MKIKHFDFYRDCDTGGIEVELDDGSNESYLVHGLNFGNDRIDVTKGGWNVQAIPTLRELNQLENALFNIEYDETLDYWHDEKAYMRNAYRLWGAIEVYRNYLSNTKDKIVPHAVEKKVDVEKEIVDKMTNELSGLFEVEILKKLTENTFSLTRDNNSLLLTFGKNKLYLFMDEGNLGKYKSKYDIFYYFVDYVRSSIGIEASNLLKESKSIFFKMLLTLYPGMN